MGGRGGESEFGLKNELEFGHFLWAFILVDGKRLRAILLLNTFVFLLRVFGFASRVVAEVSSLKICYHHCAGMTKRTHARTFKYADTGVSRSALNSV